MCHADAHLKHFKSLLRKRFYLLLWIPTFLESSGNKYCVFQKIVLLGIQLLSSFNRITEKVSATEQSDTLQKIVSSRLFHQWCEWVKTRWSEYEYSLDWLGVFLWRVNIGWGFLKTLFYKHTMLILKITPKLFYLTFNLYERQNSSWCLLFIHSRHIKKCMKHHQCTSVIKCSFSITFFVFYNIFFLQTKDTSIQLQPHHREFEFRWHCLAVVRLRQFRSVLRKSIDFLQ